MFLFINTAQNNKLTIALVSHTLGILDRTDSDIHQNHSEKLLPAVEKLLSKNKLTLKDLKGIGVVRGPGSFTGVRVGVACANALGFALNIPIMGVKYRENLNIFSQLKRGQKFKSVVPFYKCKPVSEIYLKSI